MGSSTKARELAPQVPVPFTKTNLTGMKGMKGIKA